MAKNEIITKTLLSVTTPTYPELGKVYTGQQLYGELVHAHGCDKESVAKIGGLAYVCRSTNDQYFFV